MKLMERLEIDHKEATYRTLQHRILTRHMQGVDAASLTIKNYRF